MWCARSERVEAVSVMDVGAITGTGNAAIVAQELRASILMSALVRQGICPNHVETFGVLRTTHPPKELWACSDESFLQRLPQRVRRPKLAGDYQLIRMELCRHGDLEGYLRRQDEGLVSPTTVRHLLFQMCFSLYSAREAHAMRHYDVKLLNFLLSDFTLSRLGTIEVRYGFAGEVYCLSMSSNHALCVKLADFGTADLSPETLGRPVGLEQFTTLENTPIEFLTEGDAAVQSFAADTFSLGLAAVHLFTGSMPYEEVMEPVLCPPELVEALAKVWEVDPAYSVLARVLQDGGGGDEDEDGEGSEEEERDLTLYHTFYRYLVLLGLPDRHVFLEGQNPVWSTVGRLIGPKPDDRPVRGVSFLSLVYAAYQEKAITEGGSLTACSSLRRQKAGAKKAAGKMGRKAAKVTAQFWQDYGRFSLEAGTHALLKRGRARLESLPGATALLRGFLAFQPQDRPTMHAALTSQLFECLREETRGRLTSYQARALAHDETLSFMAYLGERVAHGPRSKAEKARSQRRATLLMPLSQETVISETSNFPRADL